MLSLRRLLFTFLGALAIGWLVVGAVRGGNGDAPLVGDAAPAMKLKVERPRQPEVDAVALFTTFRLQTEHGVLEVDLAKVHALGIDKVDEDTQPPSILATAEMEDHARLGGILLTTDFPVTIDGTPQSLPVVEGLVIRFVHPKDPSIWAAILGLLTLTLMEVVLGVDNVIFLSIEAAKLPPAQQPLARNIGLAAALGTRLLLLATLSFLMHLTKPFFTLPELPLIHGPEARGISGRDLILLAGGLFLIWKSTKEIHEKVQTSKGTQDGKPKKVVTFTQVIVQIAIMDIIFSLDSVITAVGMVDDLWVMITAMIIAVGVMLAFAGPIGRFVENNPTIKVLALAFLILIGVLLVVEGLGQHLDKGYIYFAMAFSVGVELVNMRMRPKPPPPAEPAAVAA